MWTDLSESTQYGVFSEHHRGEDSCRQFLYHMTLIHIDLGAEELHSVVHINVGF